MLLQLKHAITAASCLQHCQSPQVQKKGYRMAIISWYPLHFQYFHDFVTLAYLLFKVRTKRKVTYAFRVWAHLHVICSRPKEAGGEEEAKAEDKQEEANGNESGLDELMLLAGSRRLSEEPDTAAQGEAGGTPQPEVPTRNELEPRDEDEVPSNPPPASFPVILGLSSDVGREM